MKYVRLGRTGMKVSRVAFGCMAIGSRDWRDWMVEEREALPLYRHAIERGITYFDTADQYSLGESERITGRAIAEYAKREDVVIATKVFWPVGDGANDRGLSRKHLIQTYRQPSEIIRFEGGNYG